MPPVPIAQPVQRQVTDYVDYTGRMDSPQSVGVRARVTGYLISSPFREGAEVKKGDLLYEIDPRPYQAQLDQAQSQVALGTAQLTLARKTYERDLSAGATGAVSRQDIDRDKAAVDEAEARIKAAQAAVEVYKLNLEFTRVRAPIDGRVSRYYLTAGNLVNQDQTLLTTVVSLDPLYAYFDVDEPTLRRLNAVLPGAESQADMPVFLGLQGEDGFPHRGTFNFLNNVVNPSTGTIAARGVFPNPRQSAGSRLLTPGMYVRIRMPLGQPRPALLVIGRAVGSDQGHRFVYVVDADNKVQYRRVRTGPLQDDGLRVVLEGLKADDWVVVGALQQVRPRMQVETEKISMPALDVRAEAPRPASDRPQPPPPGENKK